LSARRVCWPVNHVKLRRSCPHIAAVVDERFTYPKLRGGRRQPPRPRKLTFSRAGARYPSAERTLCSSGPYNARAGTKISSRQSRVRAAVLPTQTTRMVATAVAGPITCSSLKPTADPIDPYGRLALGFHRGLQSRQVGAECGARQGATSCRLKKNKERSPGRHFQCFRMRSAYLAGWRRIRFPKLHTRVRFPSPAPTQQTSGKWALPGFLEGYLVNPQRTPYNGCTNLAPIRGGTLLRPRRT
jgi:hypothetical protein